MTQKQTSPLAGQAQQKQQETLRVEGLDCPDCALSLEKAVAALPNVAQARLNFAAATLVIQSEALDSVVPAVQRVARDMGHQAIPEAEAEAAPGSTEKGWRDWVRRNPRALTTLVGGLLLALGFFSNMMGAPEALTAAFYIVATITSGYLAARSGWVTLRRTKNLDMNVLMTLAAIGALAIGEYTEGAMVTFLFSLGNWLESATMDRARRAIRSLMELAPSDALLLRGDTEERVPIQNLAIGDHILVRPGERIPMDGRIVDGHSAINQAPVTGESLPVHKGVDDTVFAGTINGTGVLTVKVTRRAEDNTLARLVDMIQEAQAQRAPSQRFVDRFARVYTPIVVGSAVLLAVGPPLLGWGAFSDWLYKSLVLLIIACPCALVISTPVTVVSAIARAARAGVLIKGGAYLEQMGAIRVVAFDKTGTLTRGEPQVVDCACLEHPEQAAVQGCHSCQDLIAKAAAVERRSEHPLGRAIVRHAEALGVAQRYPAGQAIQATTGMGISGRVDGHTIAIGSHNFMHQGNKPVNSLCVEVERAEQAGRTILVIEDACCDQRGYVAVADTLRPGVALVIKALKELGMARTVMLTGDNEPTARQIAAQTGIDEFRAGLLPEHKVAAVESLQKEYGRLAMVGDGVNDAPALARASVGIAMGAAGTDTALETADIALMADELSRLPFTIGLSRQALRIIQVNIVLSLVIKALFLLMAVSGMATLWMAVFADMGTSLLVTLNGLRMLGYRRSETE